MRLEELTCPTQVGALSNSELESLGWEIRQLIIDTVSRNGGHLASNLGVVELTLALLTCYDPALDKIVWDVGHQCYPYKLLTGRLDRFRTLRQYGGVSGFPSRRESPYDAFGAGHASTSVSAALGFAKARDVLQENYKVVAVIGDGALTGGMAWEAMNNAGVANTDLLVVFNDNEMSISPNDGALARHTSVLRSRRIYQSLEDGTERLLEHLPVAGSLLVRAGKTLKQSVTHWMSPEHGALFEALGFEYIGPLDGHDLPLLRTVFARARNLRGPVLVHVVTTKGKGYRYAEEDAQRFHGIGPFNASNGETKENGAPSFSQVFGEALMECAATMPQVVAITAAMPDGTGLASFAQRFPERFFDVGIAEGHAVTFAAGMAAAGLRPVFAVYSTFLQRAYDQILHDVCLQKLPVVFAIDRAGVVGADGSTHQGVYDVAYLRHMPHLVVMAPRDGRELRAMLHTALRHDGPCAIRYPKDVTVAGDGDLPTIEIGKAERLRDGTQLAFVGLGHVVDRCLEAARLLEEQGLSVAVINARFAKPLDETLLAHLAEQVETLVTVEENVSAGGFGSAVLEALHRQGTPGCRVLTVALPEEPIPHGSLARLRGDLGCTAEAIAARALAFHREGG